MSSEEEEEEEEEKEKEEKEEDRHPKHLRRPKVDTVMRNAWLTCGDLYPETGAFMIRGSCRGTG
jgi:hypothetical protein